MLFSQQNAARPDGAGVQFPGRVFSAVLCPPLETSFRLKTSEILGNQRLGTALAQRVRSCFTL